MLELILTVVFGLMAFRIARDVRRESTVFREFSPSASLGLWVLLFPVGPLIYLVAMLRVGWLPAFVLAAACYLPSLVSARRCLSAFERAGTDRVKGAEGAASRAFITAMGGLIYAVLALIFTLVGTMNVAPGA